MWTGLRPMSIRPTERVFNPRHVLAASELFQALDEAVLDALVVEMQWLSLPGTDTLFRQGDAGDALYFVVSGRLRVLVEGGDAAPRAVREVGHGETVGELALLTGEPRSATVVAVRDTDLGRLSREGFDALLKRHPEMALRLTRVLAQWLARSNRPGGAGTGVGTLALVPLGPDAPVAEFASALAAALGPLGSVLQLDGAAVDARLGEGAAQAADGGPEHRRVLHWLNEQESRHRFVLFVCDAAATRWSQRCLRHADRVLNVARADRPPRPSEVHAIMWRASGPDEELALCHPPGGAIAAGTGGWLRARPAAARHHHVRLAERGDVDRVVRRLTGSAVGLVLSGGGARGFAHLGVLRAMEELGIPIDRIGGASMGAVIGAQYAAGFTLDQMLELNRHGWVGIRPHKGYTLPFMSLVTERRASRMLRMMFDDRQIEDFWLDFFCVSADITRSELVVHRRGPAARWLLAGISVPGVAPPVIGGDGELLMDGGVLDNLPVEAMRELGEGPIVAVDVSPAVDIWPDEAYESVPTPWRALRHRLGLFARRRYFPNIFEILLRSAVLASTRAAKRVRHEVDLYLDPPVGRWKMLEMDAFEEVIAVGYEYAKPILAEWWSARRAADAAPQAAAS